MHHKTVIYLTALSWNYRIVGVSRGNSKNTLRRLAYWLQGQKFIFDAVYLLMPQAYLNLSHVLLDFFTEDL